MVRADTPDRTIAVHRDTWANLRPEFAVMVAPPISVSSLPVTWQPAPDSRRLAQQARSRGNMPVARHRRPVR